MYILTTLEFPKHNHDFHLLTTSVNAKYYCLYTECLCDTIRPSPFIPFPTQPHPAICLDNIVKEKGMHAMLDESKMVIYVPCFLYQLVRRELLMAKQKFNEGRKKERSMYERMINGLRSDSTSEENNSVGDDFLSILAVVFMYIFFVFSSYFLCHLITIYTVCHTIRYYTIRCYCHTLPIIIWLTIQCHTLQHHTIQCYACIK